jgi:hypothetical protein
MRKLHRIIAAAAFAAVPLVVGLALIWQASGEIDAARREARGVQYAGLVLPELVGLAKDGAAPAANPQLAELSSQNDADFGTSAIARAYDELKAELAGGVSPAAARNAAAMLVARIHEASGLAAEVAKSDAAAQLTRVPEAANAAPLSPALMQAARHAVSVLPAEIKRLEDVLAEFRAATADAGSTPEGAAYAAAATALADKVAAGVRWFRTPRRGSRSTGPGSTRPMMHSRTRR